jgi:hypothetical protein
MPPDRAAGQSVLSNPAPADHPAGSAWYFREDAFFWNERLDGRDFVNESGPLSTVGYQHRFGVERIRIEVFGGSVTYDGSVQPSGNPYHQAFGTNYLGCRGEYDLLIEPTSWKSTRLLIGVGTRFWVRDLKTGYSPLDGEVPGYQETWWTFYPYIGLETKESDEPGAHLFGSVRIGATPLTYQNATLFDTPLYPRCGIMTQMELGVRFQKFSLSAYAELMTWAQSAEADDGYGDTSLQPDSRMLTIGGKISYMF